MATKKILVEINVDQKGNSVGKTTKDVDKLTKATERLKNEQKEEALELAKLNLQIKEQQKANKMLAQSQLQAAEAIENTTQKTQKFKTTSGLTGAFVTELGRAASDSAYGIRGMGNNISQLVTLFGQLQTNVKKAGGGIKDSLGQIFQSMKGVIGIMTALQVVIGVIQTEWFQKWVSGLFSVNESLKQNIDLMKETANIASSSVGKFKVYLSLLKDETTEQSERLEIVRKLNEEYPEFNASLYENTERTKEQIESEKDYIRLLKQRAKSEAAVQKFQEAQGKLFDLEFKRDSRIEPIQREIDKIKELGATTVLTTNQVNSIIKDGYTTREDISKQAIRLRNNEIKQIEKSSEKEIKEAEKLAKSYEKYFDASGVIGKSIEESNNRIKKSSERRISQFKETRISLESELQRSQDELLKTVSRTNLEIIEDEKKSSVSVIDIKTNEFKERERLRLKNFIEQKEIDKKREGITQSEIDKINESIEAAKAKSRATIMEADNEAIAVIMAINKVTNARISNQEKIDELNQKRSNDSVFENGLDTVSDMMARGIMKIEAEESLAKIRYENKVARANEEISLLTTTEDRKRELEAQKMIFDQERAREQLNFKIAAIQEEKRVQQEYISFVSQTAGVLQAIGDKNKEWQKAQLALEKGAAIAGVIVNASKAIAVRTAISTSVAGIDSVAAAKDILKTKVSAGLSIAAITASGISQASSISNSGSGGSSAGGSSAPQVQAPDFNIIGSTGVNQLADAIGSTEKQPVKAFVVSSEITSQQELDRNINESAQI